MKTVITDPYLRGGVTKLFAAHVFLCESGAIKSVGIESMDLGLSKKSNESF